MGTGEFSLTSSGEFDSEDDSFNSAKSESISTLLSASNELRELAHLSLGLLVGALEARLSTSSAGGPVPALRCAMYSRSPTSLQQGKLQLQLVAATDAREAEAAQARQDLFLGVPGASGSYQEAWIVEQTVIMLPDSGGLVVPLSHNSFLVGLLVVERGRPEGEASGAAAPVQPPAAELFSGGDLGVIRQSGRALALACAMDLRAALERAGHAVRHRHVAGLVREARKPLSTLRTLGAMLRPRLEEGEPERDMTDGIVEQGARLGEWLNQLQAALVLNQPAHAAQPAAFTPRWEAKNRGEGWPEAQPTAQQQQQQPRQQQQQQQSSNSGALPPVPAYPALPSSSIGGDYWGAAPSVTGYADSGANEASSAALHQAVSNASQQQKAGAAAERESSGSSSDSQEIAHEPAADLGGVLMPLLATAANFASVGGVTFTVAGGSSGGGTDTALPAANVAVGVLPLKRMLAALLDGIVDGTTRGDCIEAEVRLQPWRGREGVAVAVLHSAGGADGEVPPSEFGALPAAARQAGGWFDCEARAAAGRPGEVAAVLWLPTIGGGAS